MVATGTPKVCTPSATQVIHTVAAISAPRAARSRCAASSSPSRTAASAMSTSSEAASTTAPTAAQAAAAPPIESATNDCASSSSPQSRTRLKLRPRYSVKPMSSRFSTVSAPRAVPNSAAATRRGTRGRQSSSTAATTASAGIRAKRLGSRATRVLGSRRAPRTRMAERAVVTRRTASAARGCRVRHARRWARRVRRVLRASSGAGPGVPGSPGASSGGRGGRRKGVMTGTRRSFRAKPGGRRAPARGPGPAGLSYVRRGPSVHRSVRRSAW